MAASTRQAMRLLSPRLQSLSQRASPAIRHQIRCVSSSRYSNPSKRTVSTAAPPVASIGEITSALEGQLGRALQAQDAYNPLDARANHLEYMEKRAYHLRRMRFAGMGLLLCIGGLAMILSNLDLDSIELAEQKRRGQQLDASDEANAQFQGREVHVVGAGQSKRIVASGQGEEMELVETGTSSVPHFPRTIYLPSSSYSPGTAATPGVVGTAQPNTSQNPGNTANQEEYTLIGLGIRTVMWIQVYVVGMYVRSKDIATLQEKLVRTANPNASALIPGEKEDLRKKLLDPEESRAIWAELLKVPGIKTAFRLSPTRNTDFGHLRDGFTNGINARTAEARKLAQGGETEFDSEEFGQSVQALKGIIAGGKAPKQSVLILTRDQMGKMDVLYQPKPEDAQQEMELLGSVPDERVSRLLWFGYLAGAKVSSQGAREGVVNGCLEMVERPVGSVETMVH